MCQQTHSMHTAHTSATMLSLLNVLRYDNPGCMDAWMHDIRALCGSSSASCTMQESSISFMYAVLAGPVVHNTSMQTCH